jgi:L-alanine-DL-glutamate epimerase-like enolase superfamily enzyme
MKLRIWPQELRLTHRWAIARELGPNGAGGTDTSPVVFVELKDRDGVIGRGEAAPSARYDETPESVTAFLERVSPYQLSFTDLDGSLRYLDGVGARNYCAKGALNMALLDGAARLAGVPLHRFLGLDFQEGRHLTSFSIGIAGPDEIREKVAQAGDYPVLKLKLGGPQDQASLQALREVSPQRRLRVDANEAWKTREAALANIEFVEQPMPASTAPEDQAWLKTRSPVPLMADESYVYAGDIGRCAKGFHAVNVKLVKCGGVTAGLKALRAAKEAGLKTMLGCMIESSVLISAAAHLAALTDFLDLDGNLLIDNDPYRGVSCRRGLLSFADAADRTGLCVVER